MPFIMLADCKGTFIVWFQWFHCTAPCINSILCTSTSWLPMSSGSLLNLNYLVSAAGSLLATERILLTLLALCNSIDSILHQVVLEIIWLCQYLIKVKFFYFLHVLRGPSWTCVFVSEAPLVWFMVIVQVYRSSPVWTLIFWLFSLKLEISFFAVLRF